MFLALQIPGLSPDQSTLIIALFAVVIGGGAIAITLAFVVRGRRMRRFREGPGDPSVPAPTDPWRRFAGALAAPYARSEWQATKGARRRHAPEQVFFGFASALPFPMAVSQLSRDWGVKNAATADAVCIERVSRALTGARTVLCAVPELDSDAVRERLAEAGAPEEAVDMLELDTLVEIREMEGVVDGAEERRDALAFDVARFANLVRWSAYVGFHSAERGREDLDVLATCALVAADGWGDYGSRYLRGLAQSGYGGFRHGGMKRYEKAIAWLMSDAASPWAQTPWGAR
ncbi:DUF1266 domain-containing protein [Microbacterium sp. G2-8]|uniref:DUF1266 domain-containing protein n=1 Tax=Microbacterium sp. G2-8 TaxID=2842454 RepID=UPI001C897CDD|nr:DUF1266 domain-containing protein [Microbacterium sp. G2-8]